MVEVKKYLAKNASALPLNGLKYYQKIMTHSVLLSTGIPRCLTTFHTNVTCCVKLH